MKKNNSVTEMVDALKTVGAMTENEIMKAAFGYDRNANSMSNKKYADMLRRGMKKGLIDRIEWPAHAIKHGRSKFIYFATKEIEVPCSAALDMEWANESENIH
tara:strand:+ start:1703 stop:2011 length:309 start_codon:yes stop_codon:yes gene_type:complete